MDVPQVQNVLPVELYNQLMVDDGLGGGLGARGFNRISTKGGRFRIIEQGNEIQVIDQPFLNVVIIRAVPHVSRIFYAQKYNPQNPTGVPPTCWSEDGVHPSPRVAQEHRQSGTCAACPNNIKGSAVTDAGLATRACAFRKRILVAAPNALDPAAAEEVKKVYAIDVNAMSIFGEGNPMQKMHSLSGYVKYLAMPRPNFPRGLPVSAMITTLVMDTSMPVSVLRFQVAENSPGMPAFLPPEWVQQGRLLATSEEANAMLVETVNTASDAYEGEDVAALVPQNVQPAPQPQVFQQPAPQPQVFQQPAPQPQVFQQPAPQPQVFQQPAPQPQMAQQASQPAAPAQPKRPPGRPRNPTPANAPMQPAAPAAQPSLFQQPASQPAASGFGGAPVTPGGFGAPAAAPGSPAVAQSNPQSAGPVASINSLRERLAKMPSFGATQLPS